jgi:phage shock protein PspC (stress-responsive transcriptional regulator)
MKRLHRSLQDSKIAGVCAGLGDYFDFDPVFFRLFFLFSILFGGLGLVAYVVLWVLVPAQEGVPRAGARLRLSSTDRKIAGVCGGLGEYFALDPVLFRAAFLVLVLAGGLGILLYLALWLVIPGPAAAPDA